MSDDDTFKHRIEEPAGPKTRPSLPRMENPSRWEKEIKMARHRVKETNTSSNSSLNISSRHSTPNKSLNSPKYPNGEKNQDGTPSPPRLYPDLNEFEESNLDDSFRQSSKLSDDSSDPLQNSSNSSSSSCDRSSFKDKSLKKTSTPDKKSYSSNRSNDEQNDKRDPRNSQTQQSYWLWFIFIPLIFVLFRWFSPSFASLLGSDSEDIDLGSRISDLKGLFPSQDKHIWKHFGSGIADVRNKTLSPAIFMLLAVHDDTTNCLASKVAELAQSALKGSGDVLLPPDQLENDIGGVLDFMEKRVKKTKAIFIPDLLSARPKAIMAFHDICDQYSPLVSEAVYVFSVRIDSQNVTGMNLDSVFEKQMKDEFLGSVKRDTLDALITRLKGAVLAIKQEKVIPCQKEKEDRYA